MLSICLAQSLIVKQRWHRIERRSVNLPVLIGPLQQRQTESCKSLRVNKAIKSEDETERKDDTKDCFHHLQQLGLSELKKLSTRQGTRLPQLPLPLGVGKYFYTCTVVVFRWVEGPSWSGRHTTSLQKFLCSSLISNLFNEKWDIIWLQLNGVQVYTSFCRLISRDGVVLYMLISNFGVLLVVYAVEVVIIVQFWPFESARFGAHSWSPYAVQTAMWCFISVDKHSAPNKWSIKRLFLYLSKNKCVNWILL